MQSKLSPRRMLNTCMHGRHSGIPLRGEAYTNDGPRTCMCWEEAARSRGACVCAGVGACVCDCVRLPVRVSVLGGWGREGRTTTLSETMEESRVAAMVTEEEHSDDNRS